jgi:hypothetical protein
MTRVSIAGFELDVDIDRTVELYGRVLEWCQCDECEHDRISRSRYAPVRQVEILLAMGADPMRACLLADGSRRRTDPPFHFPFTSCWYVFGKIVGLNTRVQLDPSNWLWASLERDVPVSYDSTLADLEPPNPDLFYVFARNSLPSVFRQVTSFTRPADEPCPYCGRASRMAGYLRRQSLVPTWENSAEMQRALEDPANRVYVSLEYRVIPRKGGQVRLAEPHKSETEAWKLGFAAQSKRNAKRAAYRQRQVEASITGLNPFKLLSIASKSLLHGQFSRVIMHAVPRNRPPLPEEEDPLSD